MTKTLTANQRRSSIKRISDNFIPKKLPKIFIHKLVSNEKIKQEMAIFLKQDLEISHKNETNWKIHFLTKKWQAIMTQKRFDLFEKICDVIEKDSKFKLPWTSNEVDQCIGLTRSLFQIE